MRALLCALSIVGLSAVAEAEEIPSATTPGWFPFVISVADGSPSAIDLRSLNLRPAGARGFVQAKLDQLLDGQGQPMRLFGTNFCGSSCFPEEADAISVAQHLAKNGVNVVRLHHMDNGWGQSLIADNATTTLDTARLARLDRLVAELIKNGIYVNLNLHVSRTYPGTPPEAPSYSKGLDSFYPPFIEQFQNYARQLLEHINPHTKRAYRDEPGIAVVEMNNENSLVLNPWWLTSLPEPMATVLRSRWLTHLQKTYGSDTAKLRAAWGLNDGTTGPNLIHNGTFSEQTTGWLSEANFGAKATLQPTPENTGIRWTSTAVGSSPWALQLSQAGLDLDESKAYRVTFRARSAHKTSLSAAAANAAPPWAQLGWQETVALTPAWQTFRFDFSPHNTLPKGQNRLVFSLLNKVTSIDLADVTLCAVPTGFLTPEQTFEAGNLPFVERGANLAVRKDFFAFLIDIEVTHAAAMKEWLRKEIGVKSLISHSQVLFGGAAGAWREAQVSDIVDTHGYWHHPSFPHKSWDMSDWTIKNVSQLTSPDGGTLAEMAVQRPMGKPYSISEYDTPAPNDFAAETFPLLAVMGCHQDWAALYHFNFKNGLPYASDHITSFFDLPGHTGKQAFMPLAALMFRRGQLARCRAYTAPELRLSDIVQHAAASSGDLWGGWRTLPHGEAWKERVGYNLGPPGLNLPSVTTDDLPLIQRDPTRGTFCAGRPDQSSALVIATGGAPVTVGNLTLTPAQGEPHSLFMLCALDEDHTIATSRRLWLCALSRAENVGMGWDATRQTVGNHWGSGPTLVRGVNATLTLPGASGWKVEALDPTGTPKATIASKTRTLTLSPTHQTVWWLLTR
jgi:Carbohydrate binding domain/Cellulase (glycosyl hydrolase family 5)